MHALRAKLSLVLEIEESRDIAALTLGRVGAVRDVDDPVLPVLVVGPAGEEVTVVSDFLRDMRARDLSVQSIRSYALALLRWLRFLWAVEVAWDRATRMEVRDFVLWMQQARKPRRGRRPGRKRSAENAVTGKPYPSDGYAARTINHNLSAVKEFYQFHAEMSRGPIVNPVPSPRAADASGRLHAHHNPMQPFRRHRRAPYRQKEPKRIPRSISDGLFNDLFAAMPSNRDRAMLAFSVSTAARASELLGVPCHRVDAGQQLVGVERKGTRELQWLPASADAFVWLRLYQTEFRPEVTFRGHDPLWITLRRPFRPLNYHAFHAVLQRANRLLGTNHSLHDLRHTAAMRMIADPGMSLADVQWVLGHAHITSTQIYLEPRPEDIILTVRAHQGRVRGLPPPRLDPTSGYQPEVFEALFGWTP